MCGFMTKAEFKTKNSSSWIWAGVRINNRNEIPHVYIEKQLIINR